MIYIPKKTADYQVIHEDDLLIVASKKAGLLSVAADDKKGRDLLSLLREQFGSKIKLLHRLDKETSGLVIATKKPSFERIFVQHDLHKEIRKIYLVLVHGQIKGKSGIIDNPLPARGPNIKVPAKTIYKVLGKTKEATLITAQIETGRQHQIRRHLAAIGHPIIGDRVDGKFALNKTFMQKRGYHGLWLHSWRLEFEHFLTHEKIRLEAEIPADKQAVLNALGFGKVI
ncbi:MAG: RluA family pseudouridine synthase [Patescibacteria group bacterium]|nr:RluA family pseudouridine synthase [Patescibacteria group bacterium]